MPIGLVSGFANVGWWHSIARQILLPLGGGGPGTRFLYESICVQLARSRIDIPNDWNPIFLSSLHVYLNSLNVHTNIPILLSPITFDSLTDDLAPFSYPSSLVSGGNLHSTLTSPVYFAIAWSSIFDHFLISSLL